MGINDLTTNQRRVVAAIHIIVVLVILYFVVEVVQYSSANNACVDRMTAQGFRGDDLYRMVQACVEQSR